MIVLISIMRMQMSYNYVHHMSLDFRGSFSTFGDSLHRKVCGKKLMISWMRIVEGQHFSKEYENEMNISWQPPDSQK